MGGLWRIFSSQCILCVSIAKCFPLPFLIFSLSFFSLLSTMLSVAFNTRVLSSSFILWGIFHSFCRQKLLARRVPRTQQLAFAAKCIQSSIVGRGRPTVLRQFSVSSDVVRKTNVLQRKREWQRFLNGGFSCFHHLPWAESDATKLPPPPQ